MMMWTTSTVCLVGQKNFYLQITRNTRTRCVEQSFHKPEKTADIQQHHWCFSGKIMSEKKELRNTILKMHTSQFWVELLISWKFASSNQQHYQDLGSNSSSVMEFLCFFLTRHLVGNLKVASENVGCFFRPSLIHIIVFESDSTLLLKIIQLRLS